MTTGMTEHKKHFNNLMKTIEGTGWILCDAVSYMARNDIVPDKDLNNEGASRLAQNISEIFEILSECEEEKIIDHIADKMLEYSSGNTESLISYLGKHMGDNPLYKKIVENSKT
ncbi:MAG: hypothetical protein MJA82_19390 [Clostridia bacterium]|nr:hypothetical protein [Clostridia bacterium]